MDKVKDNKPSDVLTNKEILDKIDFLDTGVGLERCLDDEDFYFDMLEAFVEENSLSEMKSLYMTESWRKYRLKIHTLKSSAAYIGAVDLSEQARNMEIAVEKRDDVYINHNHYPLMLYYEEILHRIDRILNFKTGAEPRKKIKYFKILIADDSDFALEAIETLQENYLVSHAKNKDALNSLLEQSVPDLIIMGMDFSEPGGGYSCLAELKQDKRFFEIPSVLLIPQHNDALIMKYLKEGIAEYFLKPVCNDLFFACINRAVELIKMQKELRIEVKTRTNLEKEKNRRMTLLLDQMMLVLLRAIDAKHEYTKEHSVRVAKYAVMIAEQLGYDEEQLTHIKYAAMLHDIGKIGVSEGILNKPSALTEDEYAMIKSHTIIGADILDDLSSVPDIAVGARWHHERYDGKGYPDGKKGEEIPEVARIIGIADAYDAMTSSRTYRSRMEQKKVREEIKSEIGKQFDPVCAEILLGIIDRDTEFYLQE